MKPKQSKNNNNKNNNNKRHKQLQHGQQQQQQASVSDGMKTSKTDDGEPAEMTNTMTSSVTEYSASTRQTPESHIPANNCASQSTSDDTDHVINRCSDDVSFDIEVADILNTMPADLGVPEVTTSDAGVSEVVTFDPGDKEVITELIMAKTFTESIHPDREFVPIRLSETDVVNPLPADTSTTLTVRCELVNKPSVMAETTSGGGVVTSSGRMDSVKGAIGQVKDLTSDFKHLQSLLDDLTSPTLILEVDTSSEDDLNDDWRQPSAESRVVYHYHLHDRPSTTRRWIRRGDQELSTQHHMVGEETVQQGQPEPSNETHLRQEDLSIEERDTQSQDHESEVIKNDDS